MTIRLQDHLPALLTGPKFFPASWAGELAPDDETGQVDTSLGTQQCQASTPQPDCLPSSSLSGGKGSANRPRSKHRARSQPEMSELAGLGLEDGGNEFWASKDTSGDSVANSPQPGVRSKKETHTRSTAFAASCADIQ